MKISGRKPVPASGAVSGVSRQSEKPKVDGAPGAETSATDVQLSAPLQGVERAKATVTAMPDVRVERVDEIKPRIDDGSYEVESKVVAKRIVDSALRESARQKKRSRG